MKKASDQNDVSEPQKSLIVTALPNLRARVAETLREAIVSGRFKPGQRLIDRELCELLGVSRTSMREAMRELEAEGLVANQPNRGPIVAVIDFATARSIYETRAALEGLVCRLFAERATDAEVDALERCLDRVAALASDNAPGPYLREKDELYHILLAGADNAVVKGVLRSMHSRIAQLRTASLSNPGRSAASVEELRILVAAIKRRDGVLAERLCIEHVNRAGEAGMRALAAF